MPFWIVVAAGTVAWDTVRTRRARRALARAAHRCPVCGLPRTGDAFTITCPETRRG